MLLSGIPSKPTIPFAASGTKNTIPTASQIGITAGAASLTDGFPPLTATPIAAGGVPPSVGDMNGILSLATSWSVWAAAGGTVQYDSTFSSAVTGYPKNALLASTTAGVLWMNTVDANTTNPDSGGSNWLAIQAGVSFLGVVSTKSANYTLVSTDNGSLILAGAFAMTLPSAPSTSYRVTIMSSATGTTIVPNGNTVNLIGGATTSTISLPIAGDFVTLIWDGSVWRVVGGSQNMSTTTKFGAQYFNSSGTFTVPAGVTQAFVQVWGAGGGSGGTTGASSASLGGGGGEYAEGLVTGLTPGGTIAVTIGTGGAAGTTAPTAGGTGGTSSFGSAITAVGGGGGSAAAGGAAGGVSTGGTGGTGGSLRVPGNTCTGCFLISGTSMYSSAGGAAFMGQAAHSGQNTASSNGIPGLFPGGGASGSLNSAAGAVGANGLVIVRY